MIKIVKILICFSFTFSLFVSCHKSENPVSIKQEVGYWEIISIETNGLNKIFFVDSENGWVVGDSGKIIYSNNGGKTWQNQNSSTKNKLISIFFIDSQKGFITGYNNTLLSTQNGGNTWKSHNVPSNNSTIFSNIHHDNDYNILFISNYGEILWSTNYGHDWSSKYKFENWGYSYLYFPNSSTGFAMQHSGNELKRTADGGETWDTYQLSTRWSGDIYFLNERYGWFTENWAPSSTIHDSTSIYITTNGGETWVRQATLAGLILDNIKFINTNEGWISQVTKIFQTIDGGKSWSCQFENENIGFIKDIYFLNGSNGWALTNQGNILKYSLR
ncbi:MAG: YCF48-related protein [Melioribacteraceae bacterium]|nr:YCF48-related protein [Melioribacteraceae bacterium]